MLRGENTPNPAHLGTQGQAYAKSCDTGEDVRCAPSLRDRLEQRRANLSRQLAEVDLALQLIYTNPDAEKIHAILHNARP